MLTWRGLFTKWPSTTAWRRIRTHLKGKSYNGPVIVIRADDDKLVDDESCKRYAGLYQAAEFVHVSGGGHNFTTIPSHSLRTGNLEVRSRQFMKNTPQDFLRGHLREGKQQWK